jgi:hypothetical protein
MTAPLQRYCLDANVLIQGWQKYYSPKLCPTYWEVLNKLGENNRVFIPRSVYDEIVRTEDNLKDWVSNCSIPILDIDGAVTNCLQDMYNANTLHRLLVDNTRQRSLADPWVIAHAMKEKACVVTKEEKINSSATKIRIPNVCENMDIRCIHDFEFIEEIGMKFTCTM